MQILKAIVFATFTASLSVATPAMAGGGDKYGTDLIRAPSAASAHSAKSYHNAKSYYVEFIGRDGPSFGHSFVRLGVVGADGRNRRIMDLGLYPAPGGGDKAAAVFGTRAVVGYTSRDLNTPPVVVVRHNISAEMHLKLAGSVGHMSRRFRYFELLHVNCNSLTGYVARTVGLKAPHHVVQRGDDYVRELKGLNSRVTAR